MQLIRQKTAMIRIQYLQRALGAATVFTFFALFTGCMKKSSEVTGEIRIGVFESLTGPEATYGQDSLKGIQLAADQINAAGGVLGRQIKLIVRDNQSKAGETSIIARELIARERVDGLLGEVAAGRSTEGAAVAQKSGVPLIASASTNTRFTQIGDCTFRVCFTDDFQSKVVARYMRSLGIRRVAIVSDFSTAYSTDLAASFAKEFKELGGEIVAQQSYNEGDKNFSAQLTAVKAANPEAIFLPSYYTESPVIIRQARELSLNIPFFGSDGWDSVEFLKLGREAVEGVYFSSHFSADDQTPFVQDFVKAYEKKYRVPPSALAALAYDSMKLIADAIQRAGSLDKLKIRDALQDTKDFPAVTGTITFDKNRNPTKPAQMIQVRDGKFHYVTTVYP